MFFRYFIIFTCAIFISANSNAQYFGFFRIKQVIENNNNIKMAGILYMNHCANCHGTTKGSVGPALQKIRLYRSTDYLYSFIKNPVKIINENSEAKELYRKYKSLMPAFPDLSKEAIKFMLDYLDNLPYDSNNYQERRFWKKLQ